jgi:hypothetical protein
MRLLASFVLLAAAALPIAAQTVPTPTGALRPFASDAELVRYLTAVAERPAPPPQPSTPPAPSTPPCTPGQPTPGQAQAVVRGRITNASGQPEAGVLVRVACLNVGATTGADGRYRLVVPGARFAAGQVVPVSATRTGLSSVTDQVALVPGDSVAADFVMAAALITLENVVVTGLSGTAGGVSITNVQHAGVDEGGIVKRHGDHLVMLRRGRLFTVAVAGRSLRPVDAVDAFGPGMEPGGTWYDELLIAGDLVVVIGFSYLRGGTEIGTFRIDRAGRLHYRGTHHLRSDDYYSSRNYASRLVGDRLVLYAPVPVRLGSAALDGWMPAARPWHGDPRAAFRRTLPATRVYASGEPLHPSDRPTLHTVTTCDLARPRLECESSAVLGPSGRVFYVAPSAVYVWTTRGPGGDRERPSTLFRLPLDGTAPGSLAVHGSPVDQFSFLESDDRHLNVLVRGGGRGDGMWAAERTRGDVALLRVPVARFRGGGAGAPRSAYRALPGPVGGQAFHNRFVGAHLLYGTGTGWGRPDGSRGGALYAVRWRDGRVTEVALEHGVDRIEAMGSDAVVVGADRRDLHFTGVRLGSVPRAAQRYVHRGASQGETRSHGFFYRDDGGGSGVLGLPVRGPGRPGYEHLFEESASVLFVRNGAERFQELGELEGRSRTVDDGCVASCVDWYGNTRPIFMDGRVFALVGYEIVEGAITGPSIREVRRVSFAPSRHAARR